MANSIPSPTDTKNQRWTKMLNYYQKQSGALAHNNHKATDSLRTVMVKVLQAIKGI
jgi:hypothetical protein